MAKTSNIIDFLDAGLRAETLRQKAIANNVANLQTPGYRRVDINFEDLLSDAMKADPEEVDLDEIVPTLYQPKQTPVQANGNDVELEGEVGQMVKNTLLHKTYIRLLSKQYQQMEEAMNVK